MKSNFGRMLLSALITVLGLVAGKPVVDLAAGPAAAKISGPSEAALRSVAVFDASASTGEKLTWSITPGLSHTVLGDGRFVAVYTGDKPQAVAVRLVAQSARGGKLTDAAAEHVLKIGGAPPAPPPGPGPGPGPKPPEPDGPGGFMGLTKISLDAVLKNVAESPTRRAEALAYAKALHAVAAECKPGGEYSTYLAAGAAAVRAKKALGDARPRWEKAMNDVQKDVGKLLTSATPIADIGRAIDAVADGLDLVP